MVDEHAAQIIDCDLFWTCKKPVVIERSGFTEPFNVDVFHAVIMLALVFCGQTAPACHCSAMNL